MNWLCRTVLLGIVVVGMPRFASGHPAIRCAAQLSVNQAGQGSITLRFDVLCFALNEEPANAADTALWALVDGPAADIERTLTDAAGRLRRHVVIRVDGRPIQMALRASPGIAGFERWKHDVRSPGDRPRLPWMGEAVLTLDVPPDSKAMDVRFPEVLGELVLAIDIFGFEARALPLRAGEQSPEIALRPGAAVTENKARPEQKSANAFLAFVRMGIEHIVPQGLDHMLFILGLYLASPRVKSLLVLVTMFTLAHSVTLALAATGVVVAPPRLIEPLIALSIAAVAIENIAIPREKASAKQDVLRASIVFLFGLVHGLGFASAFKEMELPREVLVRALIGFNIGVEIGQLLVLSLAFALIGWAAKRVWYRRAVVIPASAAIACVGLYWAATRALGGG